MKKYLIVLTLLTSVTCTPNKEKEPLSVMGNIEGTVTDFKTFQVLSGVTVEIISNANTTFAKKGLQTGEDGVFTFIDLEAGSYKLSFSKRHYVDNSRDVNAVAGQIVPCDVALTGNPDFEVENGVLTAYRGKGGNVIIPDDWGITAIGVRAFESNILLISVVVPEGVVVIGESAFKDCTNLTSVVIPEGVMSIGAWAFNFCHNLTAITFPNSLTTIERGAFYDCSRLTAITFPNSLSTIGSSAFRGCDLRGNIIIPDNVVSIGGGTFMGGNNNISTITIGKNLANMSSDNMSDITLPPPYCCTSSAFTSFVVDAANPNYAAENGVLFNKAKATLIAYPKGKQGAYIVPNSVINIAMCAFDDCEKLTAITIPASVTSIEAYAFRLCKLMDFTVAWTTPLSVSNDLFTNTALSEIALHVPTGTKAAYAAAAVWKDFGSIIEN
ncbi:MAG: leucine-rich repeat protein [Prevotellaceae bacterium]|jgi:hypothetical protein|nr:leucine-rich repeat protein [Prevotellaceae bacterium]